MLMKIVDLACVRQDRVYHIKSILLADPSFSGGNQMLATLECVEGDQSRVRVASLL